MVLSGFSLPKAFFSIRRIFRKKCEASEYKMGQFGSILIILGRFLKMQGFTGVDF